MACGTKKRCTQCNIPAANCDVLLHRSGCGGLLEQERKYWPTCGRLPAWRTTKIFLPTGNSMILTSEDLLASGSSQLHRQKNCIADREAATLSPAASQLTEFCMPVRDGGIHKDHLIAKDSSGNGNDLPLVAPPLHQRVTISQVNIAAQRIRAKSSSYHFYSFLKRVQV